MNTSRSSKADELRERKIRELLKRGGVAGAARKIIFQHRHAFTPGFMRWKLLQRYPLLEPAPGQIEDIIQRLAERRRLIAIRDRHGIVYKRTAYQPPPLPPKKPKQLQLW